MSTAFKPIFIPKAFLADKLPAEATTDAQKKDLEKLNRLQEALDACAGRIGHTVSKNFIRGQIWRTENRLDELGIPKKYWINLKIQLDGSEDKRKAYKYSYECVGVTCEYRSSGWAVIAIERVKGYPGPANPTKLIFASDEQRAIFKKHTAYTVDNLRNRI